MALDNLEEITCKYHKAKKRFFERNNRFKKFENIDEERKEEIRNNAYTWLENCSKDVNVRIALCLFNNLNNPHTNPRITNNLTISNKNIFFDFADNDEELMFYMFVMDPELKLLQINYEESNIREIKRRYFEEFGLTLDTRLLTIELIYNKRFPTIVDEFVQERK